MGTFVSFVSDSTAHRLYVGCTMLVSPKPGDPFTNKFLGRVIGVRNGNAQVCDQDDNVWEVDVEQLSFE